MMTGHSGKDVVDREVTEPTPAEHGPTRGPATLMLLATAGIIVIVFAAVMLGGSPFGSDEPPSTSAPVNDQLADDWWAIPDPVDPELAANAESLCPVEEFGQGPGRAVQFLSEPSVLVIDQRGPTAVISRGAATTSGFAGFNCGVVRIDDMWKRSNEAVFSGPDLVYTSGEIISEYVTEMRIRWPDGTEVTASLGTGHYAVRYPRYLRNTIADEASYAYIESYVDDTLVLSEVHLSYDDVRQIRSAPGQ